MATFPTLASGSARVFSDIEDQPLAQYPLRHDKKFGTTVHRFLNDTEQRWSNSYRLDSIQLEYKSLHGYDVEVLRTFFHDMRGRYVNAGLTNVFDITIGSETLDYCVFDQDEFVTVEEPNRPGYFNLTLKIKQLRKN